MSELEMRIEELEAKIEELENKIESLNNEIDSRGDNIESLEEDNQELRGKIDDDDLEYKLNDSYSIDVIETELERLDTYWKDRFHNRFTDDDLIFIKEKIINIFLYG